MPIKGGVADITAGFEAMSRAEAEEASNRWFSASQEELYDAGDDADYQVFSVAQTGQPPQFDPALGGYVFAYPHPAAWFFEVGTEPHTVEADEADTLAFEWPDAPPDVREMFADTFPTVFFPRVEVDGIDRLDYVGGTVGAAERYLEGR